VASANAAERDLSIWLGVAEQPRLQDVVDLALELGSGPYSDETRATLVRVLAYLGTRVTKRGQYPELAALRTTRWLPAEHREDRWYTPREVYASFQKHLFASQAQFLDMPIAAQRGCSELFSELAIRDVPEIDLVVKHLLYCAERDEPVSPDIYTTLNRNVSDHALVSLIGKKVLQADGRYFEASHAFWGDHPFGKYRERLGPGFRGHSELLEFLGVRETPSWTDARDVLKDIAGEYSGKDDIVDDETQAVIMNCWQTLTRALIDRVVQDRELRELGMLKCIPNLERRLVAPQSLFFEDRAGLADKFGDFLLHRVIPRPLEGGLAMASAGVRTLGSAVDVEVAECDNVRDDSELLSRIQARRDGIGRVLRAALGDTSARRALERLDGTACRSAARIVVRYRIEAASSVRMSEPETVHALWDAGQQALFHTRRGGSPPWAAIARELAIALCPIEDPGRLAAGIKEAIQPDSNSDAQRNLDELGYGRLDATPPGVVPERAALESLGVAGEGDASKGLGLASSTGAEVPALDASDNVAGSRTANEGDDRPISTTGQALAAILGTGAPQPTPAISMEPANPRPGGSVSAGSVQAAESLSRKPTSSASSSVSSGRLQRPVLRSYVGYDSVGPDGRGQGSQQSEASSAVDQAGIRRVMDYESHAGRHPTELAHSNPGYDIESRDDSGNSVRYIEVKSFSGRWRNTFAQLSRMQFDTANELGDRFWLYVVESADTDACRVLPIRNPAQRANHFMFDDGWVALAEPTSDTRDVI